MYITYIFRFNFRQYFILETTCKPTNFHTKFKMLCNKVSQINYFSIELNNDLFRYCAFHHISQYDSLGQFNLH
jgi:hypothetical protein